MNPTSPNMKRSGRKRNPGWKGEAEEPDEVVICIGKNERAEIYHSVQALRKSVRCELVIRLKCFAILREGVRGVVHPVA